MTAATTDRPALGEHGHLAEPGEELAVTPPAPVEEPRGLDQWPHTTRVLPWLLAALLAMLWLVPFNSITLQMSLPFDVSIDRIVVPLVVLVWALSLAAGGPGRPRVRITAIHIGVGAFVAVALLSVIFNGDGLNRSLRFDESSKRLVLLGSYVALFVMLASVVRPREVPAFLRYVLGLGVLCAIGVLWEHNFGTNVFYLWSDKLLPGLFRVAPIDSSGVDEIGRRLTLGPGETGLETASMLAMALPVALVGIMRSERGRSRLVYGLAACLLVSAGVSTYRKTAIVAPVVVLVTLAFLRPREIVRLLPLGVVLVAVVHVLSPGALGGVLQQFDPSRLDSVSTTEHRAVAYDAVRPLVWSNVVIGQGYGSYDAYVNRILDSQILTAVIETGVVGLLAFLAMILTVVVVAVRMARGPDRGRAPPAAIVAAVAVAFLTVSFLYDAVYFPHAPYIFLTFAGLLAVLVRPPDAPAEAVTGATS